MRVECCAGGSGGGGGGGNTPHDLLDGSIDQDTVANSSLKGSLIIGNGGTPSLWDVVTIGTAGQTLVVTGGTAIWSILGVPGGGTGLSTVPVFAVVCGGTTTAGPLQTVSGLGTSGFVLTSNGAGALPTWQAVSALLPAPLFVALTDGATITVDASAFRAGQLGYGTVTLGGNRTLTWTNGTAGQMIRLVITQGSGGQTLAYTGATCKFSTDLPAPTLSTGAGAVDYEDWVCVSSGVFRLMGKNFGF